MKILIVEDSKTCSLFYDIVLKSMGYIPTMIDDGKKAIEIVKKNKFDLIILDIQLPSASGIEVFNEIKKTINKDVKVIAITSFAMSDDKDKYLKLGFDDYMSKPIDYIEFKEKIYEHKRAL